MNRLTKRPEPVMYLVAFLAFTLSVLSILLLFKGVDATTAGVLMAIIAGLSAPLGLFVRSRVTPIKDPKL